MSEKFSNLIGKFKVMSSKANKFQSKAVFVLSMIVMIISCKQYPEFDLSELSIIPKPSEVISTGDYFEIKPGTKICYPGGSAESEQIAAYLSQRLMPATGIDFDLTAAESRRSAICLNLTGDNNSTDESYTLEITKRLITLSSSSPAGLFRGVQTLMQLLPPNIEEPELQPGPWIIPTGTINDSPIYSYRGMMLDVARHFFSVQDVKRVIDLISYYKLNYLHLHLSDDQGWRIEIKSWPKLTEIGGSTEVGGGEGGFFTQEQYSDLVNYAAERYITIIPEIDMPGHTNAALASYPELNCNGRATNLYTGTEVGFSTLCTSKEVTYEFIDDVVREISEITPGPYFHIGGDESHATKEKDYINFINRVQDIVIKHGKKVIGWDDIAISELKPDVVAQHWANVKNANMAVEKGARILMSPANKAYLDMQYNENTPLGLHWAAYIEVDSAYIWDPETYSPGLQKDDIIGIEAALWTETITNMDELEYMVFPRLPGYAEIGWTPASQRNWEEYRERLANHGERFRVRGIDFYESDRVPWRNTEEN